MDDPLPPADRAEPSLLPPAPASSAPGTARSSAWQRAGVVLVAMLALAMLGVLGLRGQRQVHYRAECVLQLEREPGAGPLDSQEWYATQRYLLTSTTLADRVVAALQLDKQRDFFGLPRHAPFKKTPREASEQLLSRVRIDELDGTRLVRVSYEDADPKRAARIANLLVESYLQKMLDDRALAAQRGVRWLEEQVERTKQRLGQVEGELQAYVGRIGAAGVPLPEQQKLVLEQIGALEQESTRARVAIITLAARAAKLKAAVRADPFEIHSAEIDDNAQVKALRAAHLEAVLKYQETAATQGAGSPLAEQQRSRLDNLRDQLASTIDGIVRGAQAELLEAQQVESQLQVALKNAHAEGRQLQLDELAYGRSMRERAATEELLTKLRAQVTTAGIVDATGAHARVVEPAVVPNSPVSRGLF